MKTAAAKVVALLLVLLPAAAIGQQQRGDFEAQLTGYYVTTIGSDASFGMGSIQAKLGYYFTDWFEFGLGPTWTITTTRRPEFNPVTRTTEEKSITEGDFGTTVFLQASLLTGSKTVPYFGAQYYKQSFRDEEDKGSVGVSAGVKFFFTRKAAFDLGGNYLFSLREVPAGQSRTSLLFFAFGLSLLI